MQPEIPFPQFIPKKVSPSPSFNLHYVNPASEFKKPAETIAQKIRKRLQFPTFGSEKLILNLPIAKAISNQHDKRTGHFLALFFRFLWPVTFIIWCVLFVVVNS